MFPLLRISVLITTCSLTLLAGCGGEEPVQDSSVSLAGSFFHDDPGSGERRPIEGHVNLVVKDEFATEIHTQTVVALTDGSWRLDSVSQCDSCTYSVKIDLPADYYPDPDVVHFFYGESLSFEEFKRLSVTGLHSALIFSENGTAYFYYAGTAGLSDFPFDPGEEIYDVVVRYPGISGGLAGAPCTYLYRDVMFRLDYQHGGEFVADYEVDHEEVYKEGETFDCEEELEKAFRIGLDAAHVENGGVLKASWDSMLIMHREGSTEGEYMLAESDMYYLDELMIKPTN